VKPRPPAFFEGDGAVIDDTAHLPHQNTSSSYARNTGYVPDEMRHESGFAEQEIEGGHYGHPVASTSTHVPYETGSDLHRPRRVSSLQGSPLPHSQHRESLSQSHDSPQFGRITARREEGSGSIHHPTQQNISQNDVVTALVEPSYTGEHSHL
jgi:hypothetical protein